MAMSREWWPVLTYGAGAVASATALAFRTELAHVCWEDGLAGRHPLAPLPATDEQVRRLGAVSGAHGNARQHLTTATVGFALATVIATGMTVKGVRPVTAAALSLPLSGLPSQLLARLRRAGHLSSGPAALVELGDGVIWSARHRGVSHRRTRRLARGFCRVARTFPNCESLTDELATVIEAASGSPDDVHLLVDQISASAFRAPQRA